MILVSFIIAFAKGYSLDKVILMSFIIAFAKGYSLTPDRISNLKSQIQHTPLMYVRIYGKTSEFPTDV